MITPKRPKDGQSHRQRPKRSASVRPTFEALESRFLLANPRQRNDFSSATPSTETESINFYLRTSRKFVSVEVAITLTRSSLTINTQMLDGSGTPNEVQISDPLFCFQVINENDIYRTYYFDKLPHVTDEKDVKSDIPPPLADERSPSASQSQVLGDERAGHLRALMGTLSEEVEFSAFSQEINGLNHNFRKQVAARLQPILNAQLQSMPRETLDQKKAICDLVEKTLEPLGLAVKVPNTPGLPGKLKATTGHWPGVGRFHFEVYIDGKQKKPAFSDTLPELTLTDATPPIESQTTWQDKVGPKSTRQSRKLT